VIQEQYIIRNYLFLFFSIGVIKIERGKHAYMREEIERDERHNKRKVITDINMISSVNKKKERKCIIIYHNPPFMKLSNYEFSVLKAL
jgi:hypothetical protein